MNTGSDTYQWPKCASGGAITSSLPGSTHRREEPEPEAREPDHHHEHPVLGTGRIASPLVDRQRAIVREHQAAHVAGDECADLDVPDPGARDHRVVDAPVCGPEQVASVA